MLRWDERIGLEGLKPGRRTRRKQTGAVAKPCRHRKSERLVILCASTSGPLGSVGGKLSRCNSYTEYHSPLFCDCTPRVSAASSLRCAHCAHTPAHSLRLGLRTGAGLKDTFPKLQAPPPAALPTPTCIQHHTQCVGSSS